MEGIIPRYLELSIIKSWLKGKTRDEIAEEYGKSQGTVSNIISRMRNSLGSYDADSIRELAKELREHDITPDNCAYGFRIFNVLEHLKIPETEMEKFLTAIYEFSQKMGIKADILNDVLLESVRISNELPFSEIPNYLNGLKEEKEQLENKKKGLKEEIQTIQKEKVAKEEKVSSSLKNAGTTLVNLDIFVNTKDKLERYGIPVEDIDKFTSCVQGIKNYSDYDPFKVLEKFSHLDKLEIEIKANKKIKIDLEFNIQKLKETESVYDDRLTLKSMKLKNLDELERKVGFGIQDLKKLKSILIEISSEHNNLDFEQIKMQFFELCERYETRIAFESENNSLLLLTKILQSQIKSKRQMLHCQELVGPFLKNLFDYGIEEQDIIAIKCLIDIILYTMGNKDTMKLSEKREIITDLASYSNLRLAKRNLRQCINNILNTEDIENIQKHIDHINKSPSSINNSENSNDRKYLVLCDSFF
jgi:transcriptional regulator with XRE-family HTH domain